MRLGTPATLLSGRIHHEQPADGGHRSGIEPVLLAASVPARAGEIVLEGGTGSGAALLCLAARVAGISGVGLEIDAARARCARANFAANGFDLLRVEQVDVTVWQDRETFDHAIANPPWHAARSTPSPDPSRELARRDVVRQSGASMLTMWATGLARRLRHRGSLTLIVPAAIMPPTLAALVAAGCGSAALLPLWPRAGHAAKLVLVQGRRGGRGPARVLPGLVLHEADGSFTSAADAVLRDGAALSL